MKKVKLCCFIAASFLTLAGCGQGQTSSAVSSASASSADVSSTDVSSSASPITSSSVATISSEEMTMDFSAASGSFSEQNGFYTANQDNSLAYANVPFKQGSLQANMQAGSVGDNGLIFGLSRGNQTHFWESGVAYYFFFVSQSGGAFLGEVNKGTWSTLAYAPISGYNVSKNYTLKVITYFSADGSHRVIDGFVNGTEYCFYRDYAALTGTEFGLRAGKGATTFSAITMSAETGSSDTEIAGYHIASGKFSEENSVITSTSPNAILYKENAAFAYGVLEADVRPIAQSDNGLIFSLETNDLNTFWENGVSYYFFFLSLSGTAYLGKVDHGTWSVCSNVSIPNYDAKTIYHLKIERDETSIVCYVGDTLYANYHDESPLSGTGYGFRAGASGVLFSNLSVKSGGDFVFTDPVGFSVKSGSYKEFQGVIKNANAKSLAVYKDAYANGTVSAILTAGSDTNNGLVVRLNSTKETGYYEKEEGLSYYFFHISANRSARLLRFDGTSARVLKEMKLSAGYSTGNSETLTVVFNDGNLKCYVNDALYLNVTDTTPLTGTGVGIRSSGVGAIYRSFTAGDSTAKKTADLVLFGHSHCEMWENVKSDLSTLGSVANMGIGGSVTGDWKSQSSEVGSYDSKYILCWLGSNDISAGLDNATIIANMKTILAAVKTANPTAQLFVFTEFYQVGAGRETSAFRAKIDALNALIIANFSSNGTKLIDVRDVVYDASGNVDSSLFRDVYHLTATAYKKVAAKVLAALA